MTVLDAPGGGQAGALRVGETVYLFAAPVGTEEALRAVPRSRRARGCTAPGVGCRGGRSGGGERRSPGRPGEPFLP